MVDTSAWIEWLMNAPLAASVGAALPEQAFWIVPTIVQHELAKWVTREVSEERADEVIAFSKNCIVAPLDTGLALASAELGRLRKLATADAIVYATALQHGADLLTCDAHFETLPHVVFIQKPPKI